MAIISRFKQIIAMVSITIFLLSFPSIAVSALFKKIPLPPGVSGPDSMAFDALGGGPIKALCDGKRDEKLEHKCGRPLGLGFNYYTNELYVADAYQGLFVLGANGGLAKPLATSADGLPFQYLNGLGVDPITGDACFTDFSSSFQIRNVEQAIQSKDATGRLLKYDANTKQISVLLKGLSGAAGTEVSIDGKFVLVSELIGRRILRFWLKDANANKKETFMTFQGRPDNIKRTILNNFFVAVNIQKPSSHNTVPTRVGISPFGTVLQEVPLDQEYNTTQISEAQEVIGQYYIGSPFADFFGYYTI